MKKFLIDGIIIVSLYILFVLYLIVYSERVENLNHSNNESSLISLNYGE